MPRRRMVLSGLPLLLAGCAMTQPPQARLPYDPSVGFADPARQAIVHTAYAFAAPGRLAGRPSEAAQAISEAEFLAVDLTYDSRWTEMWMAPGAFVQARAEWRGALGIDGAAPPQAVIDALGAVRAAYAAQDTAAAAAALPAPLFRPGGAATLAVLSNLPPLPRTAWAGSLAQRELWDMQRSRGNDWE